MLVFNRRLFTGIAVLAMTVSAPAFAQTTAPDPSVAAAPASAAPEAGSVVPPSDAAPAAPMQDKAAKHKHKHKHKHKRHKKDAGAVAAKDASGD